MLIKSYLSLLLFTMVLAHHAVAHVSLTYPKGGEKFVPGASIAIQWKEVIDHGDNNWDIYYSLDGGEMWQEVALDIEASILEYMWTIPVAMTSKALVKVIQDNIGDASYEEVSGYFTISSEIPGGGGGPVITAIDDDVNSGTGLKLLNYPNPFSDYTTIEFVLPKKSGIDLKIYTICGNLIYDKAENSLIAGTHKIVWKNNSLPGGLYLCKLEVNDGSITTRVVIKP